MPWIVTTSYVDWLQGVRLQSAEAVRVFVIALSKSNLQRRNGIDRTQEPFLSTCEGEVVECCKEGLS